MKITELLKKETMILDLQATSKNEAIEELAAKLDDAGHLSDRASFIEAIKNRESQSSTGIGEGVAIPHAKTAAVTEPAIVFGRSKEGIDYDALDGEKSHLFFMIAASEGANETHLQALSRLSTLLMDEEFRESLMSADSTGTILKAVDLKEKEKLSAQDAEEEKEKTQAKDGSKPYFVAVTGCPTGIAHTYMAADGLKDAANKLGYDIKVETNGSDGVKSRLTKEDIERADAVIIAADTKIEMDRFDGKKLINAPVTAGIRKPTKLLEDAYEGNLSVHRASGESGGSEEAGTGGKRSVGAAIYKHLMSGVSNMLPFVVGGGILIALSFFFEDPVNGEITWFGEILSTIGGANAFFLLVPVLAGFIAYSIADRPGFAAGMVGGLMASTGEAGFLGGIVAGFLAGYLVLGIRRVFNFMPKSLEGIKTILILPLFGIFLTGFIMYFLVVPMAAVQTTLVGWLSGMETGNAVILGIILGGMMAVDMGGPVNKSAYAFGIAMLEANTLMPMAAIMAGGMVPPLGIALATTLFKNKFTREQQDAGKTNYILGASFITEGAIPFAAADPARVIPSLIAGSATAGALAMLFGNATPAPHGGVFVLLLVENWPMYIVAILAGAFVTAIMLKILKKDISTGTTTTTNSKAA
ncbi:PTS fructose transporter subunit IIABC [Alkalicoccus daliensis]|uniref:PTS system D-fructose-specific IIA component (F1P-forming), Frc family /PTS system D-fructose-specific IIB component (F1P-forming), Frc family /PTS system D-fructose-specific IIC component (F1P-for... n=1 Tax=Alkalicoccus daliensis TaxID=745820 RepID=A0A1H0IQ64_9BACI|nr:PTS fructose transporter subunit IIABC [Alkalicoccus daliensis]SDO33538.1 PTS system D-fructose-specific IIA component (F1P-forming), Frc family /PTS system D-fructose-specific IIB component (F1P-forming), Frc family /PTS system D-fructose-specific IIC component (F1P-forming), Frc family [Alkalicoccus daliensis]